MRFIIQFDAKQFEGIGKRLTKRLEAETAKAMEKIGHKMRDDILTGRSQASSSAWSASQYDMDKGGNLMKGVADSLYIAKTQVGFLTDVMDDATMTDAGVGYWRLFEWGGRSRARPRARSRAGGSDDYRFLPSPNQGIHGEGAMVETNNPEKTHPGVMPTRMFQDTFLSNKKFIREQMKLAIKNAVTRK